MSVKEWKLLNSVLKEDSGKCLRLIFSNKCFVSLLPGSWTNSTHEAYYKRDISQRLKPHTLIINFNKQIFRGGHRFLGTG